MNAPCLDLCAGLAVLRLRRHLLLERTYHLIDLARHHRERVELRMLGHVRERLACHPQPSLNGGSRNYRLNAKSIQQKEETERAFVGRTGFGNT